MNPPAWGYSLENVGEIITACLDAASVSSILEIGAFRGELTALLLEWAAPSGASITTMDPLPPDDLLELARAHPELELLQEVSHGVLERLESLPDAIVIDGDHNYFTLNDELSLIGEKAGDDTLPLIFFHDVCWPHARRDTYYAPERVPEDERPPIGEDVGLAPGITGVHELGLRYPWAALEEGGPGNGTVTAIEDFSEGRDTVHFAIVPAFFGLGVLWDERAPWAADVASILAPYDRSPVLERLEANRIDHLVAGHARQVLLGRSEEKRLRQEEILRRIANSRAFAIAEKISGIYRRGEPAYSRDEIKRALDER